MGKIILYINWIVGALITISFIIASIIRLHPNYDKNSKELSIVKSSGADGPTATFLTIKLNYPFFIWVIIGIVVTLIVLNYISQIKK